METKPVIGITANLLKIEDKPFHGTERVTVNHGYVNSIIKAGGIPLLLPVIEDKEAIAKLFGFCDGLLLTGGQDVTPSCYNEEPHPLLGETCERRDQFEMQLIHMAHEAKKPILGICRGLQLINTAFKGTLYQDLSLAMAASHSQEEPSSAATHSIKLMPGSLLQQVFGQENLMTNSFHHQGIKQLSPCFEVAALSDDGVVEGIQYKGPEWILGVQWHPEVMLEEHPEMLKLFRAFVIEASTRGVQ